MTRYQIRVDGKPLTQAPFEFSTIAWFFAIEYILPLVGSIDRIEVEAVHG